MPFYHEGTKGTKEHEARPHTHKKLLWGVRVGFVSFVAFVPSW